MDVDGRQLSLDRRQVLAAGVAALTIPGWIAVCGRPDEAGAGSATAPAEEAAQFEAWSRGARRRDASGSRRRSNNVGNPNPLNHSCSARSSWPPTSRSPRPTPTAPPPPYPDPAP